jgi:hypothetical protein
MLVSAIEAEESVIGSSFLPHATSSRAVAATARVVAAILIEKTDLEFMGDGIWGSFDCLLEIAREYMTRVPVVFQSLLFQ